MAKKTKRVEKFKFMTYAEDIPNLPNLPNHGTVGKDGRILRVRADFKRVNDLMESLIEYYMAYDLLRKKLWPTVKKHSGYQDMILNSPVKVSLIFEKAYESGAGYIEHVHKSLGKMNNVLQFPNFTSYVDFLDNQMDGDEFSPTDFKVFSKLEQMYNIGYAETDFLFEILIHWEIQTAIRDVLLNWIKIAKKTRLYKAGFKLPVRKKLLRRIKLEPPSKPVTLRQFMIDNCVLPIEKDRKTLNKKLRDKIKALYALNKKKKISLPEEKGKRVDGRAVYFDEAALKQNWESYREQMPSLYCLKKPPSTR